MHSAPVVQPVAPSSTTTPSQSVFDEPHKSSKSPMRPRGVTVVQMTDDETETESFRDDHEESPMERALRRDCEELAASVPSTPLQTRFTAAAAAVDAEARESPVAESRRASAVARRIHIDPEVLRSLTSSPRASAAWSTAGACLASRRTPPVFSRAEGYHHQARRTTCAACPPKTRATPSPRRDGRGDPLTDPFPETDRPRRRVCLPRAATRRRPAAGVPPSPSGARNATPSAAREAR